MQEMITPVNMLRDKNLFIYGFGLGFKTLKTFVIDKYQLKISGIIDEKFNGLTLKDNLLCGPLSKIKKEKKFIEAEFIIVSLGSLAAYQNLKSSIEPLTKAKIIWALNIPEYHLSHADKDFLVNSDRFFEKHQHEFNHLVQLLQDEKSRLVLSGVKRFFKGEINSNIPHDPIQYQYFPKDISLTKGNRRVINAGAYDGDTLRSMNLNLGSRSEAIACFEPDFDNFKDLIAYVESAEAKNAADQYYCFPCALGANISKVKFKSGGSVNSSVDSNGEDVLTIVSLDNVLPGFAPTLITMDIEGSEELAIEGSRRLISDYLPDLAICVYHTPQQLVNVPLKIAGWDLGYKFYLRNYTGFPAETVMYATTK